jgi:hypothetical protein
MEQNMIHVGNPGFDAVFDLIRHIVGFFQLPDLEGQVCLDELESTRVSTC